MISFLAGVYIGGAIVEGVISAFSGETPKEAATAAALWPFTTGKVLLSLIRR